MEWWRIAVVVVVGVLAWATLREVWYARGCALAVGCCDWPEGDDAEGSP